MKICSIEFLELLLVIFFALIFIENRPSFGLTYGNYVQRDYKCFIGFICQA
ncbi:unnamed protein product [Callosobruchus maculatus]|uniref:Uncharacterized protein n=1 Tax=Callosobruchus maculatus TaxID=64391 RepID=A0A653BFP6_CALMS|nr:unnamed protein product [Callosobruchus maculatus]